jgi:hypothetical protein
MCDYKVWIDTERGVEEKRYLRNMVELNIMEDGFYAHTMVERKRAGYFDMQREMAREEYKEKQEKERAQKREKARRAKKVYDRGGERAPMKGKWPVLLKIDGLFHFNCINVLH